MAPRLLTLLGLLETALINQGATVVSTPPQRAISFHKGMARMNFADGNGSIVLQNFTLADGQICVKAVFYWGKEAVENGSCAIYPREHFDWLAAADQIAVAWMASRPQSGAPTNVVTTESAEPASTASVVSA